MEKIRAQGNTLKTENGIEFKVTEGNSVKALVDDVGFILYNHFSKVGNFALYGGFTKFDTIERNTRAHMKLASLFGYKFDQNLFGSKGGENEIEKEVDIEKLAGMVEAYEKLLIGRRVTIEA